MTTLRNLTDVWTDPTSGEPFEIFAAASFAGGTIGGAVATVVSHGEDFEQGLHWFPDPTTSANALVLEGIKRAFPLVPEGSRVRVVVNNEYVVRAMTEWLPKWRGNGWRTNDGKPVANQSLLLVLDRYAAERDVEWVFAQRDDEPHLAKAYTRASGRLAGARKWARGRSEDKED